MVLRFTCVGKHRKLRDYHEGLTNLESRTPECIKCAQQWRINDGVVAKKIRSRVKLRSTQIIWFRFWNYRAKASE